MSKSAYKTPTGLKEVVCSCCRKQKVKIDSSSTSGTCFRCVAKGSSEDSVFVTDLSPEDYKAFIQKIQNQNYEQAR